MKIHAGITFLDTKETISCYENENKVSSVSPPYIFEEISTVGSGADKILPLLVTHSNNNQTTGAVDSQILTDVDSPDTKIFHFPNGTDSEIRACDFHVASTICELKTEEEFSSIFKSSKFENDRYQSLIPYICNFYKTLFYFIEAD